MKFFEAKSVGSFNASDSRQSTAAQIKKTPKGVFFNAVDSHALSFAQWVLVLLQMLTYKFNNKIIFYEK